MRRSICFCEPNFIRTGQVGTWSFVFTTSTPLPKGTMLKFDIMSAGRSFEWQIPQTNIKNKTNTIWGKLPNNKTIAAKAKKENLSHQFEFTLPSAINAGENFTIYMGSPSAKTTEKNGNKAQTYTQRRKPFLLYIDPKGKGNYKDPEVFSLDVRGNKLTKLHIIVPSYVSRNKRFDVIVRFEDEYGNLTNKAPEGTLINLSYENLRENLNWQLFVPETGFITLPNLYFNEEGVYRLQLTNQLTKETFLSPPIKCFAESNEHLFWGVLHGESERIDSNENVESCLRHFRDDLAMQFTASSSFEMEEETAKYWKNITHQIAEFNEDERFVVFAGFQWRGNNNEEGLRHIIYSKDNKPLLKKRDMKYNSLKKMYKTYQVKDFISIPTFTMGSDSCFDFKDFHPEFERVVEIYNAWGSSECMKKEGNLKPIVGSGKNAIKENKNGSLQEALKRNCRFGFIAGGLDDRGIYSHAYEVQKQYTPGITAIIATAQTREAFLQALYDRHCYATTGEKIILGFSIAGMPMGSEINNFSKPGLVYNRYIEGYVIGTTKIKTIEIIRNGKVIHTIKPDKEQVDFEFDDIEKTNKIVLKSPDDRPVFLYYYLRIVQEDDHMAWSSPIWVDYYDDKTLEKMQAEKALKRKTKK